MPTDKENQKDEIAKALARLHNEHAAAKTDAAKARIASQIASAEAALNELK